MNAGRTSAGNEARLSVARSETGHNVYMSWRLMAGLVWRCRWAFFIVWAFSGTSGLLTAFLGGSGEDPIFAGFLFGPLGAFFVAYEMESGGARLWESLPVSRRACTRTLWFFAVLVVPLLQALVLVPFAFLTAIRESLAGQITLGFGYAILLNTVGAAFVLLLFEVLLVISGKQGLLATTIFFVCALLYGITITAAFLLGFVAVFPGSRLRLLSLPEVSAVLGVLAGSYLVAAKLLNRRTLHGKNVFFKHGLFLKKTDIRLIPTAFPSRKWAWFGPWTWFSFVFLGVMLACVIYIVHDFLSKDVVYKRELYWLVLLPSLVAVYGGSFYLSLLQLNLRPWRMLPLSTARLTFIHALAPIMVGVFAIVLVALGLAALRARFGIPAELTARLFSFQCICLSVPLVWVLVSRPFFYLLGSTLTMGSVALLLFVHGEDFVALKWSVGILAASLVIGPVALYRGISGSRLYRRRGRFWGGSL